MALTTARAQEFVEVKNVDPKNEPQRVSAVCVDRGIVESAYPDASVSVVNGKRMDRLVYGFQQWTNRLPGVVVIAIAPECLGQFKQSWLEAGGDLDQLSFREVVTATEAGNFDKPPEKEAIQTYRKEAENEYDRCVTNNSFSSYWECECIKRKFLEARINKGPDIHSQNILRDITTQCPNPQGVADMERKKCEAYDVAGAFPDIEDHQAFCSCVSENLSEAFAANPSTSGGMINFMRRNAWRECGHL